MHKRQYRRRAPLGLLAAVLGLLAAVALVLYGLGVSAAAEGEEALSAARESILRAAVTCYAIEGRYPADYAYLRDNYGVAVDESRFRVIYDAFAPNVLPAVDVKGR